MNSGNSRDVGTSSKRPRPADVDNVTYSPSKRRRPVCPSLDDSSDEMVVDSPQRSFHPLGGVCGLMQLPVLPRILHFVTAVGFGVPTSSSMGMVSLQMEGLRRNLSLREVSRGMRDAFDEHITAFDFQGFTMAGVAIAIERMLPRCPMLSSLCCTREATDREFAQHWKVFFEGRRGNSSRIRVLRFLDTAQFSSVPETIAAGCGTSVEELQVMSFEPHMTTSVLSSVAQHCPGVKSIDALLDGVDCRVLAGFSSLRTLRAVFRNELSMHESIGMLIWALGQGGSGLECVELRVHNNIGPGSSSLARLPEIPRLRKLSLFSSTPPIVPWLTGCEYLEKLQFEWVAELTDRVVVEVASFLGKRLKELRIWHCALLTDATLRAIAFNCSNAHVELKFDTGQFSVECVDALVSVEFEVSEVSP